MKGIKNLQKKKKALKELRSGKAAGVDNIPPEVLKVDLDITANMLHPLFENIRNGDEMPNDWRCGLLIKIPKKDSKLRQLAGYYTFVYTKQSLY
jgi:hypothetical protein